jgi:hypothetical protein
MQDEVTEKKTDNSAFERVEEFRYLGRTLTGQNSIQEGSKSRLKSGNACYYSGQNILSSSLVSKHLKINVLTSRINFNLELMIKYTVNILALILLTWRIW